jgi:hypothetical protein
MSGAALATRQAWLDFEFGGVSPTLGATLYLALFAAGVEITGGSYARVPIVRNQTNFPATDGTGKVANGIDLTFPTATADWTAIDEARLMTASSGGAKRSSFTPSAPFTVPSGVTMTIPAGSLSMTVSGVSN